MLISQIGNYGIGETPMNRALQFCPEGNLLVKLENHNRTGSSKDRLAYALFASLLPHGHPNRPKMLFDSTSGNLGISMASLAAEFDMRFTALIDETTPIEKMDKLREMGAEFIVVPRGNHPDDRTARICAAQELDGKDGWTWTNQYENPVGVRVHFETTGPEILRQAGGAVDVFVCSIGTGATICGIASYLRRRCPNIEVVAVEPEGSTIFGGIVGPYATAGAGMLGPPGLATRYGGVIDSYSKVPDLTALQTCQGFTLCESESVGITAGAVLYVARHLSCERPNQTIVALIADGGDSYRSLIETAGNGPLDPPIVRRASELRLGWRSELCT